MTLPHYAYGGFDLSDHTWHDCDFYCKANETYLDPHTMSLNQINAFLPGNAIFVYSVTSLLSGCFILDVTNY